MLDDILIKRYRLCQPGIRGIQDNEKSHKAYRILVEICTIQADCLGHNYSGKEKALSRSLPVPQPGKILMRVDFLSAPAGRRFLAACRLLRTRAGATCRAF